MTRSTLAKDLLLESLQADGLEFRAVIEDINLDNEVPSCPGWTFRTLIIHLGGVYRYVTAHIVRGVTTEPETYVADVPESDDELLAWWDATFDALITTLDTINPETPAWNWAPQAKTASFWIRRMAHETAVHRWDAHMAIRQPEPIDGRLAADGVAEVLDTWLPAGRRQDHPPVTGIVEMHASDTGRDWYVRLRGDGIALLDTDTILDGSDPQPTVIATGTASDLNLALWGRVDFDVLDIEGDEALLETLRTDDKK